MSLDVYLEDEGHEVYWANITHNLGRMASEAGIYEVLWRPEEVGVVKARDLISPLKDGLLKLEGDPTRYEEYNAPNGWGMYKNFVPFVKKYLKACEENPDANVRVTR